MTYVEIPSTKRVLKCDRCGTTTTKLMDGYFTHEGVRWEARMGSRESSHVWVFLEGGEESLHLCPTCVTKVLVIGWRGFAEQERNPRKREVNRKLTGIRTRPENRRWNVEVFQRSDGLWFAWVDPVCDCTHAYGNVDAVIRDARRMARKWCAEWRKQRGSK